MTPSPQEHPPTTASHTTASHTTTSPTAPQLRAENINLAYDGDLIIEGLTTTIPEGEITIIIGANGCGKSTLLRSLSRLMKPKSGSVFLGDLEIDKRSTKEVAKLLGLLPQGPSAPEGVTVGDLVRRGRFPHQRMFNQWSTSDADAVGEALALTNLTELEHRAIDELSGGQRQRAWIAMALAQDTPLMLLDEPTTYLDIAHQVEVLDLLAELNESDGRTIVMVLHDLNQACRYATHIVAMADKNIVAAGTPQDVITAELIEAVFGISVGVIKDPMTGTPLCLPLSRRERSERRRSAL